MPERAPPPPPTISQPLVRDVAAAFAPATEEWDKYGFGGEEPFSAPLLHEEETQQKEHCQEEKQQQNKGKHKEKRKKQEDDFAPTTTTTATTTTTTRDIDANQSSTCARTRTTTTNKSSRSPSRPQSSRKNVGKGKISSAKNSCNRSTNLKMTWGKSNDNNQYGWAGKDYYIGDSASWRIGAEMKKANREKIYNDLANDD